MSWSIAVQPSAGSYVASKISGISFFTSPPGGKGFVHR